MVDMDVSGSSLTRAIHAAIERVVNHFEENDVALRLDVLRALTHQASLKYETERVKERLRTHPVSKELVHQVTCETKAFESLLNGLTIDQYSCEYDQHRNVEIRAKVHFAKPAIESSLISTKKRKKTPQVPASSSSLLQLIFTFKRDQTEAKDTLITFRVESVVLRDPTELQSTKHIEEDTQPMELVYLEMKCASSYPCSFYEEQCDEEDEDEDEDEGDEDKEEPEQEQEAEDTDKAQDGKADKEEEEDPSFGEQVVDFRFAEQSLVRIYDWINDDKVEVPDLICFLLVLPFYEDEWLLDERICEILFSMDGEEKGEEEDDEGDDKEMEEVSDEDEQEK